MTNLESPCDQCGHPYGDHTDHLSGPCHEPGCLCEGYVIVDQARIQANMQKSIFRLLKISSELEQLETESDS